MSGASLPGFALRRRNYCVLPQPKSAVWDRRRLAIATMATAMSQRRRRILIELALQEKTMALRVIFAAGAVLLAFAPLARADGDPQAGEAVFKKNCVVCHTTEDGKNKIGPSLHGIVGRHSASLSSFQYSEAMKSADKVWD